MVCCIGNLSIQKHIMQLLGEGDLGVMHRMELVDVQWREGGDWEDSLMSAKVLNCVITLC